MLTNDNVTYIVTIKGVAEAQTGAGRKAGIIFLLLEVMCLVTLHETYSERYLTSPVVTLGVEIWPVDYRQIFKIDPHAAGAAPSDDENGQRARGYFHESQQMLYFVQQKWGVRPYLRLNVVKCATFWAMFTALKPIAPKLLHKMQHFPSSGAKGAENVAFFAGFVASCARGGAALT